MCSAVVCYGTPDVAGIFFMLGIRHYIENGCRKSNPISQQKQKRLHLHAAISVNDSCNIAHRDLHKIKHHHPISLTAETHFRFRVSGRVTVDCSCMSWFWPMQSCLCYVLKRGACSKIQTSDNEGVSYKCSLVY